MVAFITQKIEMNPEKYLIYVWEKGYTPTLVIGYLVF